MHFKKMYLVRSKRNSTQPTHKVVGTSNFDILWLPFPDNMVYEKINKLKIKTTFILIMLAWINYKSNSPRQEQVDLKTFLDKNKDIPKY